VVRVVRHGNPWLASAIGNTGCHCPLTSLVRLFHPCLVSHIATMKHVSQAAYSRLTIKVNVYSVWVMVILVTSVIESFEFRVRHLCYCREVM